MRLFFARIRDIILRLVKFFTKDIWVLDFSELSDARKRTVKNAQALVLTAKGFVNERVGREAVALSQFTLMAFVPMVAVFLFVTNGVGIERYLLDSLSESFPSSMPLVEAIRQYADNMVYFARLRAFEDAGIEYVRWVTQKDERVCHDCDDLDEEIFPIADAPAPLHPRCRCELHPVLQDEE